MFGRSLTRTVVAFAAAAMMALVGVAMVPGVANAATTATFSAGILTVSSDASTLTLNHDAGGTIHVFGGAVEAAVSGGPATLTNTDTIDVTFSGADHLLVIDGSNGLFAPGATAEGTGMSEIEFDITMGGGAEGIRVLGQDGAADTMRVFDFNGDGDDEMDPSYPSNLTFDDDFVEYRGQGGADLLSATFGDDSGCYARGITFRLIGGDGDDQLFGSFFVAAMLSGGPGDDTLGATECAGFSGVDAQTFFGGPGADTITGSFGSETMQGSAGSDTIDAGGGNDTVYGGGGPDEITAGAGTDSVNGGRGDDTLHATDGTGGNDTIDGKAGTDTCDMDTGDTAFRCETLTITSATSTRAAPAGPEMDFVRTRIPGRPDMIVATAGKR